MIDRCSCNITAGSSGLAHVTTLVVSLTLMIGGWLTHSCIHVTHLIAAKERVCNEDRVDEDALERSIDMCYITCTVWPVSPNSMYELARSILNDTNTRDLCDGVVIFLLRQKYDF